MKATLVKILTLTGLIGLLAGCVSPNGQPNNTGTGALVGGANGALIGALASRGNPVGALIGAAAGATTGAIIGNSVDQANEARREYYYGPPPPKPLSVSEVVSMAKAGVSDDTIISQINNTRSVYHLDSTAIIDLNNAKVSQKVISYMINTANNPPPPQAAAVGAAPGPNYAWVGGEWAWNGASWVWVSGRWVVAPYPHAVWVNTRWVSGPYGWRRLPGHWM
jgi:hypothetical protein